MISEEHHKFAFLADRDEIIDWYFFVARQANVSPGELLRRVEMARLQVFRDVFVRIAPGDITANVGEELIRILEPSDAFIDLVVGKYTSFAIVVQPVRGVRLVTLDTNRSETDAFVRNIARA